MFQMEPQQSLSQLTLSRQQICAVVHCASIVLSRHTGIGHPQPNMDTKAISAPLFPLIFGQLNPMALVRAASCGTGGTNCANDCNSFQIPAARDREHGTHG